MNTSNDFLRELIQDAARRLMDIEVSALCGAGHGERTPDRENQRNGYRPRRWDTRAGSIGLNIPKLRKGSYFPAFPEPRRTAEKALMALAIVARSCQRMRLPIAAPSVRARWATVRAPMATARQGSLQEAYIHGVSTRTVDDLVRAMGLAGVRRQRPWDV